MNYYIFNGSDVENEDKSRTALENFNYLVKDRNVWGFGQRTANRKAIEPGDKVIFYLTGQNNQIFVGAATLASGAYEDNEGESDQWFLNPDTLRIDLKDVIIFDKPKPRKEFRGLEWSPSQGGSSKISEHDYQIILGKTPDVTNIQPETDEEMEFALEKYLEEFIVDNWDKVEFGEELTIFEDDDGNIGQQYYTGEAGYIDILAKDKNGDFVVFELKKGRKNDEVIGQTLRYIGLVRENLAKKGEKVRGIIIVGERDKKLEYALKEIGDKVSAKVYKISFKLEEY